MSAQIIEGTVLAKQIREEITREVQALHAVGKTVRLACVQVGEKAESVLYVKNQQRVCAAVGIEFTVVQLPDSISQTALLHKIQELNHAPEITGIILELPLPSR